MPPFLRDASTRHAVVRVKRNSPEDVKFRSLTILIDGEEKKVLRFGQTCELKVTPGSHTIQAKNDIFKSDILEFDAKPGQIVQFQSGNVLSGFGGFLMLLLTAPPKVFLQRET